MRGGKLPLKMLIDFSLSDTLNAILNCINRYYSTNIPFILCLHQLFKFLPLNINRNIGIKVLGFAC